VDASGNVTLKQFLAVMHPNTASVNETVTPSSAGAVVLTGTVIDGDGDNKATPLDIGQKLVFADDGPTIGKIANSIVDFISGATVTKTLNGVVGADPNGTPYTIDQFTGGLMVNDVPLQGVISVNKQVVTYFADTNKDTIFGNAGDTAYYRLTLGEAGAGTYTFDVLVNPPPAEITFNFDTLPSGQNLFGMIGTPTAGLIVFGNKPQVNPDGSFTNSSDTINTSQGGGGTTIGVNNQMFDPGDGARFTFVKNPDPRFLGTALDAGEADLAGNMVYGTTALRETLEVTSGFLKVVQSQGNTGRTMRLSLTNLTGAPQGAALLTATGSAANLTEVKVTSSTGQVRTVLANGSAASVDITNLNAGDTVSWKSATPFDQALVQCVAGKFDIGGFGTTQGAPTPDQKLDFVVRVTDGDGDSSTDNFSIGIDGTGPFHDGVVSGVQILTAIPVSPSLFGATEIKDLDALLA